MLEFHTYPLLKFEENIILYHIDSQIVQDINRVFD